MLLPALSVIHAQDNPAIFHRMGIMAGAQQMYFTDQQFSPLIYRANELKGVIFYEAKHNRSNWNASFSFSTGTLFPPTLKERKIYNTTEDISGEVATDSFFVTGRTRTANFLLGYAYDLVKRTKWDLNAGIAIREELMYPSTFANVGTMNALSLLLTGCLTFHPGPKNEWTASINFPLMGYNSRFPYSGTVSQPNKTLLLAFFDGGTDFTSVDHYQQVNFNLGYRYALSQKWGIGADYEFEWLHYDQPLPLKLFSNGLTAKIDYSF